MSDSGKPPGPPEGVRARLRARAANAAYRATKRLRGQRGLPPPADASGPGAKARRKTEAPRAAFDNGSSPPRHDRRSYRRPLDRPASYGFKFGLGFAAGTALFRLILALILFGGMFVVGGLLFDRIVGF